MGFNRVFIHAARASNGARELVACLRGLNVKTFRLRENTSPVTKNDLVVNWGESLSPDEVKGATVLNHAIIGNKLRELVRMELKGVSVPKFDIKKHSGWLARRKQHTGGSDLLAPPEHPDYWVERLQINEEFRIHIFNGLSIRAGQKRPRTSNHSSWIRSYDAGWSIYYDALSDQHMRQAYREEAKKAIKALGYDFGAVDVAVVGKTPMILEVNSAPGLEGNTISVYAAKIADMVQSGKNL